MARPKKEQPQTVEEKKPQPIQPVSVERTTINVQPTRVTAPTPTVAYQSNQSTKTIRDKKNGNTTRMAAAFADALVRSDRANFEIVE